MLAIFALLGSFLASQSKLRRLWHHFSRSAVACPVISGIALTKKRSLLSWRPFGMFLRCTVLAQRLEKQNRGGSRLR
jgi:hypothetical protein